MNSKKILTTAKKLHKDWLKKNQGFVSTCQKDPNQTVCSRDFTRALPWKELPDVWKNHYQREARIALLTHY